MTFLDALVGFCFAEEDGLPPFICQTCQAKAESIESKLHKLRELAKDSFSKFH